MFYFGFRDVHVQVTFLQVTASCETILKDLTQSFKSAKALARSILNLYNSLIRGKSTNSFRDIRVENQQYAAQSDCLGEQTLPQTGDQFYMFAIKELIFVTSLLRDCYCTELSAKPVLSNMVNTCLSCLMVPELHTELTEALLYRGKVSMLDFQLSDDRFQPREDKCVGILFP